MEHKPMTLLHVILEFRKRGTIPSASPAHMFWRSAAWAQVHCNTYRNRY